MPPSSTNSCAVMNDEAGDARKAMASFTSAKVALRPIGMALRWNSSASSNLGTILWKASVGSLWA